MAPCIGCERQLLATFPLFARFKVRRCAIDGNAVRQHVGLASQIAGGRQQFMRDGLALASIMGPGVKPVVVMDEWDEVNVCNDCSRTMTADDLVFALMAKAEIERDKAHG